MNNADKFRAALAATVRRKHPDWTEGQVQQHVETMHGTQARTKKRATIDALSDGDPRRGEAEPIDLTGYDEAGKDSPRTDLGGQG